MRHNEGAICETCGHVMERITHVYYGDLVTRPTKRIDGQPPKIAMWYLCHYCTDDCPGGCGQARMYCGCGDGRQMTMFDEKD